jgi:hypothetical protein
MNWLASSDDTAIFIVCVVTLAVLAGFICAALLALPMFSRRDEPDSFEDWMDEIGLIAAENVRNERLAKLRVLTAPNDFAPEETQAWGRAVA